MHLKRTVFTFLLLLFNCLLLQALDESEIPDFNTSGEGRKFPIFPNPYRSVTENLSRDESFGDLEDKMISILEIELGVEFSRIVAPGESDPVDLLDTGQCVVFPVYDKPAELAGNVFFTSVYAEVPVGFIIPVNEDLDLGLTEFQNPKRISVVRNSLSEQYIRKNKIDEYELLSVTTVEEALQAVSFGQTDAYLGNLDQADGYIKKRGITSLKPVDHTVFTIPYRFAVNRSYPELYKQIQIALKNAGRIESEVFRETSSSDSFSKAVLNEIEFPLQIRGDYAYPPYEYLDENNQPTGFNVDIIKAVADVLGLEINIQLGQWDEVRKELENRQIDALIGMFETVERQKTADFSVPHFVASYAIFVNRNSSIQSIDDLYGKVIIVQNSDMGYDFMTQNMIAGRLILCDTPEAVLDSLNRGLGDAAILSRLQGIIIKKEKNYKNLVIAGPPILKRNYCIAVPKGRRDLLALINEGLNEIRSSGQYQEIYSKWFGVYDREDLKDYSSIVRLILFILLCIIALLVIFVLWIRFLRRLINRRTGELQKSGEQLRVTLASIADAVITTDTEGLITTMNHTASKITGYIESESVGLPLRECYCIYDNSTNERIEDPINEVMQTGNQVSLEKPVKLINKNGDQWIIDDSAAPIRTEDGTVIGVVLVFRDMTEELRMRDKLLQSQKMRALGELAGGVAHDFNNMLGGIMGSAELLTRYVEKDSKQADFLNIIITSSRRAADLTKKLLMFSRHTPSDMKAVDINLPVKEALDLLEHTADPRIRIIPNILNTPIMIKGDASLLQNAFLNLFINAVHAMPEGGCLWIETRFVELTTPTIKGLDQSLPPGIFAEVEVRDSGCGIPKELQQRIFEPFFTTKEQGAGTGLGLAAVFGTVNQHKGSISVYSEIGRGTVFKLLFPVTEENPVTLKELEREYRGNNETVLVVDDEPAMQNASKGMLELMGMQVILAGNGLEALEIFRKKNPLIQLVLLDMTMPGMNGKDCFFELKKIRPDVKVIISSGFAPEKDIELMKEQGLSGFIRKPYQYRELNHQVAKVMES